MTPQPPSPETFAWDASALHHAIAADRVDVLLDLANHAETPVSRHVTTAAVTQELAGNGLVVPPGIEVVNVDGLDEIIALARWVNLMSASQHNRGEATICAWAEVHHALIVMDDRDARLIARREKMTVIGSLAVIAGAVRTAHINETSASNLVDNLIAAGARYPFSPGGYIRWAGEQNLLP